MSESAPSQANVKSEIRRRRRELESRDRDLRTAALTEVSAQTRPLFVDLQRECALTGHEWKFSHFNWDNSYAWDKCQWCGAGEGADKHERQSTP